MEHAEQQGMRGERGQQRAARLGRLVEPVGRDREQQPEVGLPVDDAARDGRDSGDIRPVPRVGGAPALHERDHAGDERDDEHERDRAEEHTQAAVRAHLGAQRTILFGDTRVEELLLGRREHGPDARHSVATARRCPLYSSPASRPAATHASAAAVR